MLDFWNKVGRGISQYDEYVILGRHSCGKCAQRICRRTDATSALSSPLTSLSSLAGEDEDISAIDNSVPLFSLEDIRVAQVRCTRLQLEFVTEGACYLAVASRLAAQLRAA